MKSGLTITRDNLKKLFATIKGIEEENVLVGVPAQNAGRDDEEDAGINNAALAYIHDNGAPEANIPARPFLAAGILERKDDISQCFRKAAEAALDANKEGYERQLNRAGLVGQTAVKNKIQTGPFDPLSDATLRARARRKAGRGLGITKGANAELASRAAGNMEGTWLAKPLIDTAQMRNSITYVIRRRQP